MLGLFLMFTAVPAAELYFLIQAGKSIGVINTIYIVLLTGVVGAYFAKQEGRAVLNSLNSKMQKGEVPTTKIMEGVLILVGGVLLVTPGFFTDFVGLCFVFPLTRKLIVLIFKERIKRKIAKGNFQFHTNINNQGFGSQGGFPGNQDGFSNNPFEEALSSDRIADAKDVTPKKE